MQSSDFIKGKIMPMNTPPPTYSTFCFCDSFGGEEGKPSLLKANRVTSRSPINFSEFCSVIGRKDVTRYDGRLNHKAAG